MRTARMLLLMVAMVLSSVSASSDEPLTDEASLREIKEVLWPKAYFEQDTALLNRILADEFRMVDGAGTWSTKADEIEWVTNNKPSYESMAYEILRLEIFNGDTAIVAGQGTILGTDEDGPYVAQYQSTNVLIKRDNRWRAVASHVSGYRKK